MKGIKKSRLTLLMICCTMIPLTGLVSTTDTGLKAVATKRNTVVNQSRTLALSSQALSLYRTTTLSPTSKEVFFDGSRTCCNATETSFRTDPTDYKAPTTPRPLNNGVTVTGTLNATDESDMWYIDVSSGARNMWSVLTCPYETDRYTDFDLYAKRGAYPTNTSYDWSAHAYGSDEAEISNPGAGRWYVLVFSWRGKGIYQLTVTLLYAENVKPLTSGTLVTGSLNATTDSDLRYIDVPNGTASMRSVFTCPSGADFDLYGKWGSYPTISNYSWRGCSGGGEDVNFSTPKAGRWYIMPYSYLSNGTYQLTVTIGYPVPLDSISVSPIIWFSIGLTAFAILLAFVVRRRGAVGYSLGEETRRGIHLSRTEVGAEPEREQERVSASHLLQCARCGASLEVGASYCWNCGAETKAALQVSSDAGWQTGQRIRSEICMVCKSRLARSDGVLSCPYCGSLAQEDHFLEWLHVKNFCPTCGRHLDERNVSS